MPQHFVNIRLEGDYPIPTLSAVWKRYRNDAAGAWELIYQERIQRPCNLARCLAEYFSTYYHRQERGLIFGGVYVTRIARFNGLIDMEPAGMEAFHPVRLDRRTVLGMRIAQTFPREVEPSHQPVVRANRGGEDGVEFHRSLKLTGALVSLERIQTPEDAPESFRLFICKYNL
ncbi:hypothetical protein E3N88_31453 [Mikania micrantha]|uniref:Uncharacterized protein n=1 Tax=Mikania micrantha TaxID=192012 RepID=A0A5N6MQC3_9ASTR|nr:hypothetical protein E3N88_31453 [Mikania micrantha]